MEDGRDASVVKLFLDYDGADDLIGDLTAQLSSGVAFVATNRDLAADTRVQLVLSFPGLIQPITVAGTVRSSRSGTTGIGIALESGAGRDQLAVVIDRIRDRDPELISRLFRLLVVDDNHHMATLIQGGLRAATRREFGDRVSFAFRLAPDGRTAIEILGSETFDALIIDVYLPVLDGPQVISQVRRQLGLSELPIIAISAGGDAARRSALAAGANIFFDKPMRLRQVTETIQRLLRVNATSESSAGTRLVAEDSDREGR
jgi:CheY-like chemotaxis protein